MRFGERVRGLLDRLWGRDVPPGPSTDAPGSGGCVPLLDVEAVGPGAVALARIGDEPVAVCRFGGSWYVVENTCPHAGGSLSGGSLEGASLVCPMHGWPFDVRTGACGFQPSLRLRRWRAWAVDGKVCVDPVPLPSGP